MPWFKVDDALHSHPKAIRAGTPALGLWARCGSWAAQQLTNGFVPVDVARMYGTPALARRLVEAGLWIEVDGGYQFHEWEDRNPTREQVEQLRETKRTAGRIGGKASGKVRAEAKQTPSTTEAACFPSGSEVPNTHPIPTHTQEKQPPLVPPRGETRRVTQLPGDWTAGLSLRSWFAENCPDVDLDLETAQWRDHHTAKGTTAKDWDASWRTWMRNAQRWNANRRPRPGPLSDGYSDNTRAHLALVNEIRNEVQQGEIA